MGICDRTHHLSLAANAGRAELARYTLRVPTLTGGNARFTRSPPAINCRPFRAYHIECKEACRWRASFHFEEGWHSPSV